MAEYIYKTHIKFDQINENNELSDKGLLGIMTEGAGLHSQEAGYGLNSIKETKCAWMIIYWKVKILKRPCWNTEVTVKTWPREFSRASIWRDFEVTDNQGEKIAIGTTEWVPINEETKKLIRITEKMANDYGIVENKVFEEEINGKIKEPENLKKVYEYTSGRRDIDTNHHVNNIIYLELAYNALPEGTNINFENLEIYYKKQVKIGDTVSILYGKEENTNIIAIKSQDEKTLHALLKLS